MSFSTEFEQTCHSLLETCGSQKFHTILADPPWRFQNRTGKVAPEHRAAKPLLDYVFGRDFCASSPRTHR